jgi:DNA-binding LacI/PurR family transcriptional regulator
MSAMKPEQKQHRDRTAPGATAGLTLIRAPRAGKATVKDVARVAGVSIATVSRVINNSGLVASDKQNAVERALATLDYIPNQLARSLISRRSRAIGLVVPTISNPLFGPTIAAIERRFDLAGYAVLIHCCERDPVREFKQVRALIERGVDGLILTGSVHLPELEELLSRHQLPYVSQDVAVQMPLGPSIALDNAGAMRTAIDHLYDVGHRRIAVLTGPIHNTPPVHDRFVGAVARIREHQLDLPAEWLVVADDYESLSIRAAARRLLDHAPTAVACTGDILALGLVAESRARGLRVPADLSLIGCGNTDMGQYVDPPLTTVHMPFVEMGETAAQRLLALIVGQASPGTLVLPHELIVRDTVAAPY